MHVRLPMSVLALALCLGVVPSVRAEQSPAPPKEPKLEFLYLSVADPIAVTKVAKEAQRAVEAVPGVRSFSWLPGGAVPPVEVKIVRVVGEADTPALVAAFRTAGVAATPMAVAQTRFAFVSQLHCNGCVLKVKRALKAVEGTKEIKVAGDKNSVAVVYDSAKTTPQALQKALTDAGHPCQ